MGAVDLIKSARARLSRATGGRPVVFHHVPKCAGTSVSRSLRMRYPLSQATVLPEASFRALADFRPDLARDSVFRDVRELRQLMLLYHLHAGARCVAAHVPFCARAHRRFSPEYAFVTVLREPVSRFMSNYHWSHGRAGAHGAVFEPLEPFLDTPMARSFGTTISEYFADLPPDADFASDEAVERASANLGELSVVGFLDRMDVFQADLRAALGVRVYIGHARRRPAAETRGDPEHSTEIAARIRDLCDADIRIYEAARKRAG